MIVTKRSDELRPGDVFSTNGATVVSVVPVIGLRTGIKGDEICVGYVFDAVDGLPFEQRFDYVDPSMPVHVWVPDDSAEAVRRLGAAAAPNPTTALRDVEQAERRARDSE